MLPLEIHNKGTNHQVSLVRHSNDPQIQNIGSLVSHRNPLPVRSIDQIPALVHRTCQHPQHQNDDRLKYY